MSTFSFAALIVFVGYFVALGVARLLQPKEDDERQP